MRSSGSRDIFIRKQFNLWLKTIAIAVLCAFLTNTIAWAADLQERKTSVNIHTLQVQSIFNPIIKVVGEEYRKQVTGEAVTILLTTFMNPDMPNLDINAELDKWYGENKRLLELSNREGFKSRILNVRKGSPKRTDDGWEIEVDIWRGPQEGETFRIKSGCRTLDDFRRLSRKVNVTPLGDGREGLPYKGEVDAIPEEVAVAIAGAVREEAAGAVQEEVTERDAGALEAREKKAETPAHYERPHQKKRGLLTSVSLAYTLVVLVVLAVTLLMTHETLNNEKNRLAESWFGETKIGEALLLRYYAAEIRADALYKMRKYRIKPSTWWGRKVSHNIDIEAIKRSLREYGWLDTFEHIAYFVEHGALSTEDAVAILTPETIMLLGETEGKGLKDKGGRNREDTAKAIGKLGWKGGIYLLTQIKDAGVNDADDRVRRMAIEAIGKIGGEEAFDVLTPFLKDPIAKVRSTVVKALWRIGGKEAIDKIAPLLNDPDDSVRINTIKTIVGIDDRLDFLIWRSKAIDRMRGNAAEVRGGIGDSKKVMELLIPLLRDPNAKVRSTVVKALWRIGGKEAIDKIAPLLNDPDDSVRINTIKTIVGIDDGIDILIWSDRMRGNAVEVRGSIGDSKKVTKLLIPLLRDPSAGIRTAAVKALGRIGGKEAIDKIVPLLNDPNNEVRINTVIVIGSIGDSKKMTKLLIPLLRSPNATVCECVAQVLGKIGDQRAVGPLIEALKSRSYKVIVAAADALDKIADEKAVESLIEGLKDETAQEASIIIARLLSKIFADSPQALTKEYATLLFKFISDNSMRINLEIAVNKNGNLIIKLAEAAVGRMQKEENVNVLDFNILVYAISSETVPLEAKQRYLKLLYGYASNVPNMINRSIYIFSLNSVVQTLGWIERQRMEKDKEISKIINNLRQVLSVSETPPYDEINKTKEFNIRMYAPLSPETYDWMFVSTGFKKTDSSKEKGVIIYIKEINGVKVTVFCDPGGNPENYKGEIFKYMADPNIHMVVYSGHTGMGASLAFAFNKAPRADTLQPGRKIIGIFSCNSALCYLGTTKQHYPYSDFIGTTTPSTDPNDAKALCVIIEGITKKSSWKNIKEEVDRISDEQGYIFPHQKEKYHYIDLDGNGIPDINQGGAKEIFYMSSLKIILLQENNNFDFEPGNVAINKIRTTKVSQAIGIVKYFFNWNEYLKEYKDKITPAGLTHAYRDERNSCFVCKSGEIYKVSINIGYRNCSTPALVMMALHDLNLHFTKVKKDKVTALDKLRGLQLVAEFVKYYHKEQLFKPFLEKYGYENITLEMLLKTLDNYGRKDHPDRIRAANDVLKVLGGEEAGTEKLKIEGLISQAASPRERLHIRESPQPVRVAKLSPKQRKKVQREARETANRREAIPQRALALSKKAAEAGRKVHELKKQIYEQGRLVNALGYKPGPTKEEKRGTRQDLVALDAQLAQTRKAEDGFQKDIDEVWQEAELATAGALENTETQTPTQRQIEKAIQRATRASGAIIHRAKKRVAGSTDKVEISFDLSTIPASDLEQNMATLAGAILSCAGALSNVKFRLEMPDPSEEGLIPGILENDVKNAPTEVDALAELKRQVLARSWKYAQLDVDELFRTRINAETTPDTIQITIWSKHWYIWMRENGIDLADNQFPISLDGLAATPEGVAFRDIKALIALALAEASFIMAKRMGEGDDAALAELVKANLAKFSKLYGVFIADIRLTEDTLKNMVDHRSAVRLNLSISLALPPHARKDVDKLLPLHEYARLLYELAA